MSRYDDPKNPIYHINDLVKCAVNLSKNLPEAQKKRLPKVGEVLIVKNVRYDEEINTMLVSGVKSYDVWVPMNCFTKIDDKELAKFRKFLHNPHQSIKEDGHG